MQEFKGKKLLVLGGASVHLKLIVAAKELGAYTIVTDNLPYEKSPGKQIANEYWDIDIYDVQGIIQRMKKEGITAVISGWLDPCQRPYAAICQELGIPCYGSPEQFLKMTDKHRFKKMCLENQVDVIPEYTIEGAVSSVAEFPLFVKPVDCRGSRGQTVCWNRDELLPAIDYARSESSNGDIVLEKYMNNVPEVQITYFFIQGEPYLIRTTDSYNGREEAQLEKVVACSVSPSRYTKEYLDTAHKNVVKMFQRMGFRDGPIFMQGFYDNGVFRFFDPGLRFPGVDFDKVFKTEYGVDFMKLMVGYAINGEMSVESLPSDMYLLNGKRAAVLFPFIQAGVIREIKGSTSSETDSHVFSFLQRHSIGDTVEWTHNVNQRFAEIDLLAENTQLLKETITAIQNNLCVLSTEGNDLLYEKFDVNRIN